MPDFVSLQGVVLQNRGGKSGVGAGMVEGIVNLFTVIDEVSPQWELFRAISTKNGVKLPEKEDLFPTLRGE